MSLEIKAPESRKTVVACRLTLPNKKFIEKLARRFDASESYIVNQVVEKARLESASNKEKSRRSS
jgi:hypothetical protein